MDETSWLLCDFHIHTKLSDGFYSLEEVIDLYGNKGFDIICITDHLVDNKNAEIIKKQGFPNVIFKHTFYEYIDKLKEAARKAKEEYDMLLVPGFEITNWKFHIIAFDCVKFVDPNLSPESVLEEIKGQGGVSIVPHPYLLEQFKEDQRNAYYIWENLPYYKDIVDAWELANRYYLYSEVDDFGLSFVASSDLHQPEHFYSWKTLLKCEKNISAVKEAIKAGNKTGITKIRR